MRSIVITQLKETLTTYPCIHNHFKEVARQNTKRSEEEILNRSYHFEIPNRSYHRTIVAYSIHLDIRMAGISSAIPSLNLEKDGWVQKLSDRLKRWRKRYAVLRDFQLSFADSETARPHYFIDLRLTGTVGRSEFKTLFTKVPDVVNIKRQGGSSGLSFFSTSIAENEQWRDIIQRNLDIIEKCEKYHESVAEGRARDVIGFNQNSETKSFVNYIGRNGKTAVQLAAAFGDEHILQILIAAGADVNIADGNGMTALHEAAKVGNKVIITMLLEAGASVCTATVDQQQSPLYTAISCQHNFDTICTLYQAGADVNFATVANNTPLYAAVQRSDLLSAKLLLEASADPNICASPGNFSPLFVAVQQEDVTMVQLLLDVDPNTGQPRPCQRTGLSAGADAAGKVGKYGVDINIASIPDGETALFKAVASQNKEIAKLLLTVGANPNAATRQSNFTPLYQAVLNSDTQMVQLLLEHKALPNIPSSSKRLPIDVAIDKDNSEIVTMLEKLGRQEHVV